MKPAKENMCRAEVYRMAGEIAMLLPELETDKAETHFARGLAHAQQAKSWELRATMSMARP
jgi:hypothetical protein